MGELLPVICPELGGGSEIRFGFDPVHDVPSDVLTFLLEEDIRGLGEKIVISEIVLLVVLDTLVIQKVLQAFLPAPPLQGPSVINGGGIHTVVFHALPELRDHASGLAEGRIYEEFLDIASLDAVFDQDEGCDERGWKAFLPGDPENGLATLPAPVELRGQALDPVVIAFHILDDVLVVQGICDLMGETELIHEFLGCPVVDHVHDLVVLSHGQYHGGSSMDSFRTSRIIYNRYPAGPTGGVPAVIISRRERISVMLTPPRARMTPR